MPVDTALIEAVLVPVPGDNPAGADLRYDARYDQIKEARREDLDIPGGGERKLGDWPQVIALSRKLLETETKDLQLAGWLAEALLKRDGLSGFAAGLDAMRGLLDGFWETVYPAWDEDDPELRAGPLEWVGTRLDVAVRQLPIAPGGVTLLAYQASRGIPTEDEAENNSDKRSARAEAIAEGKLPPEEADRAIAGATKAFYKGVVADVDAAGTALAALEKVADDRFGRDAPSFMRLRAALDDMKRTASAILAQKLIDDPDPIVEEPVDGAASAEAPVADGPLTPEPVSAADAAARVGVAARYLRKQDPTNPASYLMVRGFRWGELRASGDGVPNPKLLEAPPTAIRVRLKGLLLDGKWPELLEQCEQVMATPQGRGWLDLQRYVLTACGELGYDAVATAVRGELRALLAAVPRLTEMTLMDDTPTANAETQQWLDGAGLTAPDAAESGDSAEGGVQAEDAELADQTDAMDLALGEEDATSEHGGLRAGTRRRAGASLGAAKDPFATARTELAQGRPNRAIELLLAELSRERSPRGRFVRQTQIAYVMVEAGHHSVAQPILERLVTTIDERTLEDWEAGPLVAQPIALLCRVYDQTGEEGAAFVRNELYLRVCRLDPLQALVLQRA